MGQNVTFLELALGQSKQYNLSYRVYGEKGNTMKKSKYFITFNGYDTLEVTTEISKKEHNRMRDELSLQVHKYEDSEENPE